MLDGRNSASSGNFNKSGMRNPSLTGSDDVCAICSTGGVTAAATAGFFGASFGSSSTIALGAVQEQNAKHTANEKIRDRESANRSKKASDVTSQFKLGH